SSARSLVRRCTVSLVIRERGTDGPHYLNVPAVAIPRDARLSLTGENIFGARRRNTSGCCGGPSRPQRSVSLRQRQKIQEMLRRLDAARLAFRTGSHGE